MYWISMPQDGDEWWVVVNMELEVKAVWASNSHKVDKYELLPSHMQTNEPIPNDL